MINYLKRAAGSLRRLNPSGGGRRNGCNAEQHASYYDSMYAASESYSLPYNRSHYYFLWSVIVDRIRRSQQKAVLEVGCGSGQLASYLLDVCEIRYRGFDFSEQAVRMAKQRVPGGDFFVSDARLHNSYGGYGYDTIICTEVLEHVDGDLDILSRFAVGARCLCSVPSFDYESHVRWFSSIAEVSARYGRFFDNLDIAVFKSPVSDTDLFFLMDGVRSAHTTCEVSR